MRLEQEGYGATGKTHGDALQEIEQHQQQEVLPVFGGQLPKAMSRRAGGRRRLIVQTEALPTHQVFRLRRQHRTLQGMVFAPVL